MEETEKREIEKKETENKDTERDRRKEELEIDRSKWD